MIASARPPPPPRVTEKKAMDPNREIRTMILLSLPYPPLPVLATRVERDDGRLHEDEVTTSHTFIAQGLQEATARNDPAFNAVRRERQQKVFQDFLHAMATEGFACDVERLYSIYCRFSLEQIASYFPPGHPIDIRFQPLSYIARNDKSHAKMAEYMAGQSLFYEDSPAITREQYLAQDFATMLLACRDRLGHVMTEDERARLDSAEPDPTPDPSQLATPLARCNSDITGPTPCEPAPA